MKTKMKKEPNKKTKKNEKKTKTKTKRVRFFFGQFPRSILKAKEEK